MSTLARPIRLSLVTLTITAQLFFGVSPALAAPPSNDDFDSATVAPAVPYSDAMDTREATTAADDPDCFGRGPTVWYAFTPTQDMRLEANTFGSDYDTTLSVYTGARGALTQVVCNDDAAFSLQSRVRFDALAGETYFFMVGAFASGAGGNLMFTLDVAPPAPPALTLEVNIDPAGSVVPSKGVATIQGTVTCSRPVFVDVFSDLQQRAGRVTIRGFGGAFVECDGVTPWSFTVFGENGRFAGGRADASVFAFAFDEANDEFAFANTSTTVRLRGSSGR